MCGFVGTFSTTVIGDEVNACLSRMNDVMSYRGPDSKGVFRSRNYACAFSRLKIIDLEDRANQPFQDASARYTLAFNGEIYNYLELRVQLKQRGHQFVTESDTEVLLNAFIEWGMDCANRLVGMFAFALYDSARNEVYLCRDQLGIKPIYYTLVGDALYFSSEIKPFSHVTSLKLNCSKLIEYACCGSILGSETLFEEISELEPGCFLSVNSDLGLAKSEYFNLSDTFSRQQLSLDIHEVERAVTDSIMLHTRSDVGYGTQLSGGLDSSLLTAIVATKCKRVNTAVLQTFSTEVDHPNLNESIYQEAVSEQFNTRHSKYKLTNRDLKNHLLECIWMYDYPLHHPNIVASYLTNCLAKTSGNKVLLSGEGADELFMGYAWQFGGRDTKLVSSDIVEANLFTPLDLTNRLFTCGESSLSGRHQLIAGIDNVHTAGLLLDQSCHLPKWFQRQDRAGMYASLEVRVPYCNVELFRLVNSLSFDAKTNGGCTAKHLLKTIGEGYLSADVVHRDKIGFGVPLDDWFRDPGGLGAMLHYLNDDMFRARSIYDHATVENVVQNHLCRKSNHGRTLWMLLNIELWHRLFIDNIPASIIDDAHVH